MHILDTGSLSVCKRFLPLILFSLKISFIHSESGEGGRMRRRETMMCERNVNQLPLTRPNWGPGQKARDVPWQWNELVTFWFTGWCSMNWVTPNGGQSFLILFIFVFLVFLNIFIDYAITVVPFPPLHSTPSCNPLPHTFLPHCSCPWVILISSLASTFPTLFLPSPCLFSTYHLCYLFSVPSPPSPPPTPLLTTLHVISISMVLFLF